MPLPPMPHAISREPGGVLIEWDTAGHAWLYPGRELRLACPCAACVEEMSGRRLLATGQRGSGGATGVARAGRGLRTPDSLERRARHRDLHVRAPASPMSLSRLPSRRRGWSSRAALSIVGRTPPQVPLPEVGCDRWPALLDSDLVRDTAPGHPRPSCLGALGSPHSLEEPRRSAARGRHHPRVGRNAGAAVSAAVVPSPACWARSCSASRWSRSWSRSFWVAESSASECSENPVRSSPPPE